MSQYKLIYFNARALGEGIRLIFAEAEVEFSDIRVPHDQWEDKKVELSKFIELGSLC